MQKASFKIVAFLLLVAIVGSNNVYAQKKKSTPAKKSGGSNPFGNTSTQPPAKAGANPFGNAPAPAKTGNTQTTTSSDPFASKPASNDPFASKPGAGSSQPPAARVASYDPKIPMEVVKSSSAGDPLNDSLTPSLRNDGVYISNAKDRIPLAYDDIREDDAIYRQRLWYIIDAREKINQAFKYDATEDNGSQLFFAIIYRAVTEDSVMAFEDERFTIPYKDVKKFKAKFSGGMDTSEVKDFDGNVIRYEVRSREFPMDSIYKFMVKEDVVFDKESSKLVRRIIGIAPMGPTILPSGKVIEGPHFPKFWIYYPDLRKTLAKKQVFNPNNMGARLTWEDYLENHRFSYYIVKSTYNNIRNQNLDQYVKDPLFRLLEGERIKSAIFSYEQGLWAY